MASELLADLAREYEKSQALLEQIEDSLKDRVSCPAPHGPDDPSATVLPESDEHKEEEEQGEWQEDASELPDNNSSHASPGLRSKLANFFSRNRSKSFRSQTNPGNEDIQEPKRRISVVTLAGPVTPTNDCPRRSVSFLAPGSHAPLQPTSALHRSAPRASLEIRQQQLFFQEPMEPGRLSSSNLGAFPAAPLRRKSTETFAAPGRRTSAEANPNHRSRLSKQPQSPVDATTAAVCSHSQLQQLAGAHSLSAKHLLDVSPPPPPPPLLSREDSFIRPRSQCRRRSDNATGFSPVSSVNAPHQNPYPSQPQPHQPPPLRLGSPMGSSTSGCLSPSASSAAAGLPTLPHPATSSRSLMGNNSSSNLASLGPMRAHSLSAMAPAVPVAAAGDADGAVYNRGPLTTLASERCSVSATGMLYPPAADVASPVSPCGGGAGGGLPAVALPQLPQRARSVYLSPSALLGAGGGSPKGDEPRQQRSFRCGNPESGSGMLLAGQEETGGRRHSAGQYAASASGGGGGEKEAVVAYSFRGTMHLI